MTYLIQHQFGINFSFDANIDQNKTAPIRLKDSNFLQFLEVGLNKLDMRYQVVSPNHMKIMAKAQQVHQSSIHLLILLHSFGQTISD